MKNSSTVFLKFHAEMMARGAGSQPRILPQRSTAQGAASTTRSVSTRCPEEQKRRRWQGSLIHCITTYRFRRSELNCSHADSTAGAQKTHKMKETRNSEQKYASLKAPTNKNSRAPRAGSREKHTSYQHKWPAPGKQGGQSRRPQRCQSAIGNDIFSTAGERPF